MSNQKSRPMSNQKRRPIDAQKPRPDGVGCMLASPLILAPAFAYTRLINVEARSFV